MWRNGLFQRRRRRAAQMSSYFTLADTLALYRADGGIVESGGTIVSWSSQVGDPNTLDITPGRTTGTFIASDPNFNGQPSVQFDGVNDGLNATSTTFSGTDRSVLAVYRCDDPSKSLQIIVGSNSANDDVYVRWGGLKKGAFDGGTSRDLAATTNLNDAAQVTIWAKSAGSATTRIFEGTIDRGTVAWGTGSGFAWSSFALGSNSINSGARFAGRIAEARIIARTVSASEVADFVAYAADRYGI